MILVTINSQLKHAFSHFEFVKLSSWANIGYEYQFIFQNDIDIMSHVCVPDCVRQLPVFSHIHHRTGVGMDILCAAMIIPNHPAEGRLEAGNADYSKHHHHMISDHSVVNSSICVNSSVQSSCLILAQQFSFSPVVTWNSFCIIPMLYHLPYTVKCRYNTVQFITILHTALQ